MCFFFHFFFLFKKKIALTLHNQSMSTVRLCSLLLLVTSLLPSMVPQTQWQPETMQTRPVLEVLEGQNMTGNRNICKEKNWKRHQTLFSHLHQPNIPNIPFRLNTLGVHFWSATVNWDIHLNQDLFLSAASGWFNQAFTKTHASSWNPRRLPWRQHRLVQYFPTGPA